MATAKKKIAKTNETSPALTQDQMKLEMAIQQTKKYVKIFDKCEEWFKHLLTKGTRNKLMLEVPIHGNGEFVGTVAGLAHAVKQYGCFLIVDIAKDKDGKDILVIFSTEHVLPVPDEFKIK